jgi:hypothetical protein
MIRSKKGRKLTISQVNSNKKNNHESQRKQVLRFMKTIAWMDGKTADDLTRLAETKTLENYPVDATTFEEAVDMIEKGLGLRSTRLSRTDLKAIEEVVTQWKKEQDRVETTGYSQVVETENIPEVEILNETNKEQL